MGHTHLPRESRKGTEGLGMFLNTGTWVDRFRAPAEVMAEGADEALVGWLKGLWKDERKPLPPTFGELRIGGGGGA